MWDQKSGKMGLVGDSTLFTCKSIRNKIYKEFLWFSSTNALTNSALDMYLAVKWVMFSLYISSIRTQSLILYTKVTFRLFVKDAIFRKHNH